MYEKLVITYQAALQLHIFIGRNNSNSELEQKVRDASTDFLEFFEKNRFYFSENTCQKLLDVINPIGQQVDLYRFGTAAKFDPLAFSNSWNTLKVQVRDSKKALEDEFRTLMGVTQ